MLVRAERSTLDQKLDGLNYSDFVSWVGIHQGLA